MIARAPKLAKDPSARICWMGVKGQATGAALLDLAAAGVIYGSRIDVVAGAG